MAAKTRTVYVSTCAPKYVFFTYEGCELFELLLETFDQQELGMAIAYRIVHTLGENIEGLKEFIQAVETENSKDIYQLGGE